MKRASYPRIEAAEVGPLFPGVEADVVDDTSSVLLAAQSWGSGGADSQDSIVGEIGVELIDWTADGSDAATTKSKGVVSFDDEHAISLSSGWTSVFDVDGSFVTVIISSSYTCLMRRRPSCT